MGTSLDLRITASRVTSGTLYARLVAAIISSAGSPRKSNSRSLRQTLRSTGQTWSAVRTCCTAGSSRSTSIRPSWKSLEISQNTIPETPHFDVESNALSAGRNLSIKANMRICVSRFSIPFYPCF
jgi:hypothetical protein